MMMLYVRENSSKYSETNTTMLFWLNQRDKSYI